VSGHLVYMLCVVTTQQNMVKWEESKQYNIVVIGKPEQQVRKASHCGSKQQ